MKPEDCILAFKSIHHVVKGEDLLRKKQFWTDMIPNPRGITSDCGMSIKVHCADLGIIVSALRDGGEPDFVAYRQKGSIYEKIEEGEMNGIAGEAD